MSKSCLEFTISALKAHAAEPRLGWGKWTQLASESECLQVCTLCAWLTLPWSQSCLFGFFWGNKQTSEAWGQLWGHRPVTSFPGPSLAHLLNKGLWQPLTSGLCGSTVPRVRGRPVPHQTQEHWLLGQGMGVGVAWPGIEEAWALVQRAWRQEGKQYCPVFSPPAFFKAHFGWFVPRKPMCWKMLFSTTAFPLALRLKSKFLSASGNVLKVRLLPHRLPHSSSLHPSCAGLYSVLPTCDSLSPPGFVCAVPVPGALHALALTGSFLPFFSFNVTSSEKSFVRVPLFSPLIVVPRAFDTFYINPLLYLIVIACLFIFYTKP